MKQKSCKTSSILFDLKNSSFQKLTKEFLVYQYHLPPFFQDRYNEYAILHNWAKDNLTYSYYLNVPSKKLYVLIPRNETVPELTYDDKKLLFTEFNDYKTRDKFHIIVKLLLAKYFELTESFVSNDKFFLYASLNRSQTWATVLKIDVNHNYKNTDTLEFFIKDESTRLRRISVDEFEKYYSKEIIYGQSFQNDQLLFKQLKRTEIRSFAGSLFTKPKRNFVGNTKAKINYHSIMDARNHESSKAFLLERFSTNYLQFLNEYGINAKAKELNLVKLKIEKQRTELNIKNFKITLVDGRKVKKIPLSEIFEDSDVICFSEKSINALGDDDNCLFVMDYKREDFIERFQEETDPYKTFKERPEFSKIAKQGICINENAFNDDPNDLEISEEDYLLYKGLGGDDLERNLGICITQLFLKRVLLDGNAALLPHNKILKGHCFSFRNYLLSVNGNYLELQKFDTPGELFEKIGAMFTNLNVSELFESIYNYHWPFSKGKEFDFLNHRFVFSNDSVIEIVDIPERAFYEEVKIRQRINERNLQRSKAEFKSKNHDLISRKFNNFIDEEVDNAILSFEELKTKYGKGNEGFLARLFNSKDERRFVKFLCENTDLQIKGLKEGGIFSTYTGLWFDEVQRQYFVGRTHGYKQMQDKGSQMKKVLVHFGTFNDKAFFDLLNVDFIRYKEITVNPYPFKLIEMFDEINKTTTNSPYYVDNNISKK